MIRNGEFIQVQMRTRKWVADKCHHKRQHKVPLILMSTHILQSVGNHDSVSGCPRPHLLLCRRRCTESSQRRPDVRWRSAVRRRIRCSVLVISGVGCNGRLHPRIVSKVHPPGRLGVAAGTRSAVPGLAAGCGGGFGFIRVFFRTATGGFVLVVAVMTFLLLAGAGGMLVNAARQFVSHCLARLFDCLPVEITLISTADRLLVSLVALLR